MDAVDRYLRALPALDWEAVSVCLAEEGFVRIGPFADRVEGRAAYLTFLRDLIPTLEEYRLDIHRVAATGGDVAVAEISETMLVGDRIQTYPEALVFDLTGDGRIRRITIYIQHPGGDAVVPGGRAGGGDAS